MVIVSDVTGKELRVLKYDEYDFEVGSDENSFQIKILTNDWEELPRNARIYIPGTEYGGIYKRTEVDTKQGYIAVGGITWRGMLQAHIIEPESGENYARDSGNLNMIIASRVTSALPSLFVGGAMSDVNVDAYQYNRYVTLYDGLTALCKQYGQKLRIVYDQTRKAVVVDAVPIVDYSSTIQFSSDMRANYFVGIDNAGVNHLICLGNGQLAARTVIHLYSDADGNISQTQTFYGADEVAEVYDYAGADYDQLLESGTQQLQSLLATNEFSISVEDMTLEIGDIVGGKDYVTGLTLKAPVTGKIVKYAGGFETTEYTISDNVEVY